ncbi:hypothetical protein RHO13_05775 [Orbus wheelerorum]|uniref:hypothetical protein n=1 Tax=Orbus wheelerorum TaxID=3074111 RepID=UPI00370DA36B
MKKYSIIVIILFSSIFFANCSQKRDDTNKNQIHINQEIVQPIKNDTILVKLDDDIILKWDVVSDQLIENENYINISTDKNKIKTIVNSICNDEDLGIKVQTKKENLKKGDVAFLYLIRTRKIYLFSCLKVQFDVYDKNYKYAYGLLDYIEEYRLEVQNKVKACIK